jgi:hypothetical protein
MWRALESYKHPTKMFLCPNRYLLALIKEIIIGKWFKAQCPLKSFSGFLSPRALM